MKTRKTIHKAISQKKYTRKIVKGGNPEDVPCGVNDKGALTKCPPNHRCEIIDNNPVCKPSVEIKITNGDRSISLFVPWKRHEKWLKYYDILNKQFDLIKSLRSDRKMNKKKLTQDNKILIDEINNKEFVKGIIGANNSDELIIQKIILMDILEHMKNNTIDTPNIGMTELDETQKVDQPEAAEQKQDEPEAAEQKQDEPEAAEKKDDEQEAINPLHPEMSNIKKDLEALQDEIGILPGNIDSKEYNDALKKKEKLHNEYLLNNNDYDFLYPELDDPNFNIKIAKQKEFNDTQYDGTVYNVKERAEKMCSVEFELLPHQLFVRNFLSIQTPYNSLLLYHGLGTGKTCSAIGISEEMRSYIKNIGSTHRIIVVASPNVQSNFLSQLFDERKLVQHGGVWNLNTCVGNELLKELNPMQLQNVPKEKVITQIKSLIKQYYVFMGYGEFANYIKRKTMVDENTSLNPSEKRTVEIENIRKFFNNRLIIIDEVHNISSVQSNKEKKKTSAMLMHICKYAENIRLLLLSATPMYNSYREIIWLTNLLNLVNKKSLIREEEVFDKNGEFVESKTTNDGRKIEGGKELLKRKLTGYVSYVRGENPYTFPYRIYPDLFDAARMLSENNYPKIQMNKKPIEEPMKHLPIYTNSIGLYQAKVYNFIMKHLHTKIFTTTMQGQDKNMPTFENMESFGYTLLTNPIQCLNIAYPNDEFDNIKNADDIVSSSSVDNDDSRISENEEINVENSEQIINNMVGAQGLSNIMTYKLTKSPYMLRNGFEYKPDVLEKHGRIFSPENLAKYSDKMSNICNIIKKSKGIVMIYSQYIDSGVVPMALALEEMGLTRYGSASYTTSLFNEKPTEPIDSLSMLNKTDHSNSASYTHNFNGAKYVMITGDKNFSPNNSVDLKKITSKDNIHGEKVKVILITKAAAEGLDFKNIRQLHILEPWYNASRIEQIIGRSVRNLSHCALPFEERNVEIYLHGTITENENEEAADLYVYRYAEKKAVQIGNVTRLLKESAVDCILNIGQTNMTLEKLTQQSQGQEIQLELSSMTDEKTITYQIGDKPYTELCDYMDSCNYVCSPTAEIEENELYKNTYNEQFAKMNYPTIIKRIREVFREQSFYKRDDLLKHILTQHNYPIEHIDYALTQFVNNKSEHILDKFGRYGYLINKREYYVFQPFEITDEYATLYEREVPIDLKYENLDMELPIEKTNIIDKEKSKKNQGVNKDMNEPAINVDMILADMKKEIDSVENERKIRIDIEKEHGELDSINKRSLSQIREKYNTGISGMGWYSNAGKIYDILINKYKIPVSILSDIFVFHYLDILDLKKHLILISNLYNRTISEDNAYYNAIKKYYDKNIIQIKDKKGVLVPSGKNNALYIFNDTENKWIEGKPTDYILFEKQMQTQFSVNSDKINNVFGFMHNFKGQIMFKIKNTKGDKNNTGAICENLGKVDILHRIQPIINENPYKTNGWPLYNSSEFENILKPGLCVFLECIMRYYNESTNDKVWFLDITRSLSSNVTKK